jgi:hypothetical protein
MSVEAKRLCGWRKVNGLYLVAPPGGMPCDRLPFPLDVCPTCGHGIKQTRGWTWVDLNGLTGGVHFQCKDTWPCPFCMDTAHMGKVGLLWIGTQFYPRAEDFEQEVEELGISRRIAAIPRGFEVGKTWVLLAHPKKIRVPFCRTEGCAHVASIHTEKGCSLSECDCKKPDFYQPAIFKIFRPTAIEKIVTDVQAQDQEAMDELRKRGITPVVVPAGDKDHQGSVYEVDEEAA